MVIAGENRPYLSVMENVSIIRSGVAKLACSGIRLLFER
jgi:hypothetical protein